MATFANAGVFFIVIFIGSFAIWLVVAFLSSWILKKKAMLNPSKRNQLEASVVII